MNDKMVEEIRVRATDPQWAYMMKELFPQMMSYTPGGINYNLNRPVSVRVANWVDQHQKLTAFCELLGVGYNGRGCGYAEGNKCIQLMNGIQRAIDLSVSGNLRKVRNQWKKVMRTLCWDYSDPLWRRADGRDADVWAQEWRIFRAEIRAFYPEYFTEEE